MHTSIMDDHEMISGLAKAVLKLELFVKPQDIFVNKHFLLLDCHLWSCMNEEISMI